tara:strand:- start:913 stop:1083 length:171 start_codon:yes stop_codon:yes gene_type:complete
MVKDKHIKKDVDVKPVIKEVVKEISKPKLSYHDKQINRKGKAVTIRTYTDGRVEEL